MKETVLPGVSETHVIKSIFVNLTKNSDDVSRAKRELGLQTQNAGLRAFSCPKPRLLQPRFPYFLSFLIILALTSSRD